MKILLDENLPHALRHELASHDVCTVTYLGWSGIKNGELIQRAANDGFDAMLTMDDGVEYQQNLATLPIAVVILEATSNDFDDLKTLLPTLKDALAALKPRSIVRVRA